LNKQRALVLGGGGALGAYQAGVLRILCKRLIEEDKKKVDYNSEYDHDGKPLLFDIISGTSIGAMNGAVFLSQYLKTGSWETAAEQLEQFWTDKEKGLASTVSEEDLKKVGWEEWSKQSGTSSLASAEAARRYYSAKYYFFHGAPKVQETIKDFPQHDSRFFDNTLNSWYLHKSDLLEKTILKFARRKITTSHEKNQPRLLVFCVDAAEGKTVTFDSYSKADRSRKSGVKIGHLMASGTLPEFYDYKQIGGRKFWDGGLLSNTPFRELLQAHQVYWMDVMSHIKKYKNNIHIPDLEVYIVNLHPAKRKVLPNDHDGVKDRQNDIIFGDRSSHYDEKMAYAVADLKDFATQMKKLSREAISKVRKESDKKELREKFDEILRKRITKTTAVSGKGLNNNNDDAPKSKYDDLLKGQYRLKVARIERGTSARYDYYADSVYGKIGDFTAKSIDRLIQEGKRDATDASLL
jgi:NTE family protein